MKCGRFLCIWWASSQVFQLFTCGHLAWNLYGNFSTGNRRIGGLDSFLNAKRSDLYTKLYLNFKSLSMSFCGLIIRSALLVVYFTSLCGFWYSATATQLMMSIGIKVHSSLQRITYLKSSFLLNLVQILTIFVWIICCTVLAIYLFKKVMFKVKQITWKWKQVILKISLQFQFQIGCSIYRFLLKISSYNKFFTTTHSLSDL